MKYRIAIFVITCILTSCRSKPPSIVVRANDYFTSGQYDKAIEYYNKALKKKMIYNDLALVNYKLGECYRLSKDTIISLYYEKTIDLFKQGVDWRWRHQKKNEKIDILYTLALAYYNLDNYNQASNWFGRAYRAFEFNDSVNLFDQSLLEKYVLSLKKSGQDEKADTIVNDYIYKQNNKLKMK